MLAKPFGPERAFRVRLLDQDGVDGRHITCRRDQIVVQVLGSARYILFHQSHADTLGNTALNLSGSQHRIDHSAKVVRCRDLVQFDRAEHRIHAQFCHLRAPAIDRIGRALTIRIQRGRGRIIGLLGGENEPVRIFGQARQINPMVGRPAYDQVPIPGQKLRLVSRIGMTQDGSP